jgi:NADPH:quinone reductase-like Zn-dependent oxidoreductase
MGATGTIPKAFEGIGYAKPHDGFPLEAIRVPVPRPGPDQVLIHVAFSSLNPLDYKLADLNFFGRTPPVILGLDLAGTVVEVGAAVKAISIGDKVAAMADSNGDGGWATGGQGGYALAREFYTAKKPASLSFSQAAALPLCFIAAYLGLHDHVRAGDVVYIPGGGGGVGHLALQIASRILAAGTVISSGSTPESMALARASGADHVFDYKKDDIGAEIAKLTARRGADVVYDITYSERSFVDTAGMVRERGKWIVLGVGPGKTSRTAQTTSPVAEVLAAREAQLINVNMLRYFTEPALLDDAARSFFRTALHSAMSWATEGRVVPHIEKTIESSVEAINHALGAMRAGRAPVGKIVVQVDQTEEVQ